MPFILLAMTPRNVLLRTLAFILLLLLLLYEMAFLKQRLVSSYSWLSYLPSRSQLPGTLSVDSGASEPFLSPDFMAQVERTDSLQASLELDLCPKPDLELQATKRAVETPPVPSGLKIHPFSYSAEGYGQLSYFFNALSAVSAGQSATRILHYGDSQIEGDRITSYIRSRLQKAFGGYGVGMVSPVSQAYPPYGLTLANSRGWKRYSVMPAHRRLSHLQYGLNGSVSHFTDKRVDSALNTFYYGEVTIKRQQNAGRGMLFNQCLVLLRTGSSPLAVSLQISPDSSLSKIVQPAPCVEALSFDIPHALSPLSFRFSSSSPVDIYALSLQSPNGIQVDNIPMRGSAGIDFRAFSDSTIVQTARFLKPSLIILQFGDNVVPSRLSNYNHYREQLKQEILRLKRLLPEVSFILIGVSDMGFKDGETYRSYPNVTAVRDAQRSAALQAGIAFWDCFTAMGGRNAIIAWVNARPPLATSDYVHFTPRGARFVGELFYAALIEEYNRFINGSAPTYAHE